MGLYSGQHTEEELGHCQLPQQVVRFCLVMVPYSNIQTIIKGHQTCTQIIRESVDSLCRDGADAQYMQYLRKSRIISPQIRKKLI